MFQSKIMENNFELPDNMIIHDGHTLYQVRAVKDIEEHNVVKGDLGGYVDKTTAIVDNAWIADNAKVYDHSTLMGNSIVKDNAVVNSRTMIVDSIR